MKPNSFVITYGTATFEYSPKGKAAGNVYSDWGEMMDAVNSIDLNEDAQLATNLEAMNEAVQLD
jgi:hypothetical protein